MVNNKGTLEHILFVRASMSVCMGVFGCKKMFDFKFKNQKQTYLKLSLAEYVGTYAWVCVVIQLISQLVA